ncbi:MAG: type II toxin-antitoxin system HicB family antitoxin [Candidatus Pacearchaeota archaeon]
MARKYHVVIEKDEDGGYVGRVPKIQGCLSQGETIEEPKSNIKEAIQLCIESNNSEEENKFVGIQEISV